MSTIRLPFSWENIQPNALDEFDPIAWGRYTTLVDYITNTKGLYAIIDVHNYARYGGETRIIGEEVPLTVLLNLWTRLASYYGSNDKVIFGMMNEPNSMSTMLWANNANSTVKAIRNAEATNIILVPGNGWTGAWSWNQTWPDSLGQTSNAEAMLIVVDPLNNMFFEFHQYFDENSSGTQPACEARPIGTSTISVATDWLRKYNKKGFLGELGGSDQTNCINAINDALTHLEANSDVWIGWAYWSGGPRTSTAFLAIGPLGYPPIQNTQLDTVLNYVANPLVALNYPDIAASSCSNSPPMVIFDEALQNSWENWGWANSLTLESTQASTGTYAISFKSDAEFEGLQLTLSSTFKFENYNAIQFDVKGASANLVYEISLQNENNKSPGRSQVLRGYTPSHSITTAYQTATIPFSVFHIDSTTKFKSIVWQSGVEVQDAIYLDNIKLVCVDIPGGSLSGSPAVPSTGNNPTGSNNPSTANSPSGSNNPSASIVPSSRLSNAALNVIRSFVVFGIALASALLL